MSDEAKQVVRAFIEECINKRNLDALEQYFSSDFVDHTAQPGLPEGIPGRRAWLSKVFEFFPDLRAKIDAQVSEGEWVATRVTSTASRDGSPISTGIANFDRVVDGKIVEKWEYRDPGLQAQINR